MSDADLIALGRREIDAIGLVTAADGRSTAASSGCPRRTRSTTTSTRTTSAVIRGWLKTPAEPRARRPQRHAQVQQSGPLDDDRPPRRAEHPRPGPVTTPGRSTPTPSTTKSAKSPTTRPAARFPPPSSRVDEASECRDPWKGRGKREERRAKSEERRAKSEERRAKSEERRGKSEEEREERRGEGRAKSEEEREETNRSRGPLACSPGLWSFLAFSFCPFPFSLFLLYFSVPPVLCAIQE